MTTIPVYAVIAVLVVVLASVLIRRIQAEERSESEAETDYAHGLWDGPGLNLAEKLFDSTDYLWLRRSIGFPHLARELSRSRKQMALQWLRCLRMAFDDLVRIPGPEAATSGGPAEDNLRSWRLLWLTLRFHLLVSYAILVVRLFGPYHRLVPSLHWIELPSEADYKRESYETVGPGRLS